MTDEDQRSDAPEAQPEPEADGLGAQHPQVSVPDTSAPRAPDRPEESGTPDRVQEPERAGDNVAAADLPQPEASPELRSAIADRPGTDTPSAGRPDVAAQHPADYVPSPDPPPRVDGPHEGPENWAADVNQDRDAPGRDNNCGECARAVDSTWNGDPAAAAALSDPDSAGEPVARMTDWAGQAPAAASMPDIQQRLDDLGPGSSAVVGCDWNDGGGHWFNAVNDGGTVKAVDGQSGRVETWPPSADGLGFDESDMRYSDAVFFTADGKVVRQ